MHYYGVIFEGTPHKQYFFSSNTILPIGEKCEIVADGETTYDNPVTIIEKINPSELNPEIRKRLRRITSYKVVWDKKRPSDCIENVYFNEEKGVTCVVWKDGKKTLVRCQSGDIWDKEKALALCYMKRVLGNRGSFNEVLKKYCYGEEAKS